MAMFLAEMAFLLELALFAAGLVLWHKGREATAGLLRAAAVLLIVGAALTAVCTVYFAVRYHLQGEFDHAYAGVLGPCGERERGMGPGMMGHGMMGRGMMQGGMPMGRSAPEPAAAQEEAQPAEGS